MSVLVLIASSDDFLLEDGLQQAVASASEALGGIEPELLANDVTAESVAVEVRSPSLFSPSRLLVVREARRWLNAPEPAGAPRGEAEDDPTPLVAVLGEGLPDGVGLVIGAWCGRRPKGPLVDAVEAAGQFEWIPVPEPPKPWEDVVLSAEQRATLGVLLRRVTGGVRFTADAEQLLLERLGFAPRLLVQEASKLAAAAGPAAEVDERLVRELTFPRERSLESVRGAVLDRDPAVLLDLVSAASSGVPVRDWQGQRVDPNGLALALFAQVFNLLQQLLALHRLAVAEGLEHELDPARTSDGRWYRQRFATRLAPQLLDRLERAPSPLGRGGKPPSAWSLGQLFAGAARYSEPELVAALAEGGSVEAALRGALPLEALSAWLTGLLRPQG